MSRFSSKRENTLETRLEGYSTEQKITAVMFGVLAAVGITAAVVGHTYATTPTEQVNVTVGYLDGEWQPVTEMQLRHQILQTKQAIGYKFEDGNIELVNPKLYGYAAFALGVLGAGTGLGMAGAAMKDSKKYTQKAAEERIPKTRMKAASSFKTGAVEQTR